MPPNDRVRLNFIRQKGFLEIYLTKEGEKEVVFKDKIPSGRKGFRINCT